LLVQNSWKTANLIEFIDMKIIIADDSELIRIGLRTVLRVNIPHAQIYDAKDSASLFQLARTHHADLVMIDYAADQFSIHSIAELKARQQHIHFIAMTYRQSSANLETAIKAGISSYITKDCDITEIIDAAKETYNGKRYFCKKITRIIAEENLDIDSIAFDPNNSEPIVISPRELEIIRLIANGLTNSEIADKLCLSTHTVNTHRRNIMAKLSVNNTAGIVMYAIKANLIQPNKFLFG
jgi:DNA-binding NarL/FixJ family response regulator